MFEQESLVALQVAGFAIADGQELGVAAQAGCQCFRQAGVAGSVGAFNADQNQARHQAVAQLVHQKLLLRRRRSG